MTNSTSHLLGVVYVQKIKQIGVQIENGQSESPSNSVSTKLKVSVNKHKHLTFDSLREILCRVAERSKDLYYDVIKQNRAIRRKLLSNIEKYAAVIESLETELSISVGTIANEVYEAYGVSSEKIDFAIVYHLRKADRQKRILKDLVETRMKHRMEQGNASGISESELEKIFKYLKEFTSDAQNFKKFGTLARPAWNLQTLLETYLFDKIWEEFEIEEEDILGAISKLELNSRLLGYIGEYQSNLNKMAAIYSPSTNSKFLAERYQTIGRTQED